MLKEMLRRKPTLRVERIEDIPRLAQTTQTILPGSRTIIMQSALRGIESITDESVDRTLTYVSPNNARVIYGYTDNDQKKSLEMIGAPKPESYLELSTKGLRARLRELRREKTGYNQITFIAGTREEQEIASKAHLRTILVESFNKLVVGDVADLTPESVKAWKPQVKAIAFDADNTLFGYHEDELPAEVLANLKALKTFGYKLFIASNCYNERDKQLNENAKSKYLDDDGQPLFTEVVTPATVTPDGKEAKDYKKPHEYMPQYIAEAHGYGFDEVLFVGDQRRSDGEASGALGMSFVHVDKRGEGDHPLVRLYRPFEKAQRFLEGSSFFPRELMPLGVWQDMNFLQRALGNYRRRK